MASSFLKKKAEERARIVDEGHGSSSYGGTSNLKTAPSTVTAKPASSVSVSAPSVASSFLKDKAGANTQSARQTFKPDSATTKTTSATDRYSALRGNSDFKKFSSKGAAIKNQSFEDIEKTWELFGTDKREGKIENIVTYSRDNWEKIAAAEEDRQRVAGSSLYRYMKDEEVDIYNYLLAKNGKVEAQKYLDSIESTLGERHGEELGDKVGSAKGVGGALAKGSFSLGAGTDQWVSGVKQLTTEERLPTSPTQVASQAIQENMGTVGKTLYNVGTTVGNMLPSIILSNFGGALAGGVAGAAGATAATASKVAGTVGKVTSALTMGGASAGNTYNQAMATAEQEGYTKGQAKLYAGLVGASEAVLGSLLGGAGNITGLGEDVLLAKVAGMDKAFARLALSGAIRLAGEEVEEIGQLWLEPALASLILKRDFEAPTWQEHVETAIVTALSTGLMEAPSVAGVEIDYNRFGEMVLENHSENAVIGEALANAKKGSAAHRLALQLEDQIEQGMKPSASDIGRLHTLTQSEINPVVAEPTTETTTETDTTTDTTTAAEDRTTEKKAPFATKAETDQLLNQTKSEDKATADYATAQLAHEGETVVSPIAQTLMDKGMKPADAVEQAALIMKVQSGQKLTKSENAKLNLAHESVRTAFTEATGVEVTDGQARNASQRRKAIHSAEELAALKAKNEAAAKAQEAAAATAQAEVEAVQQAEQQQAQAARRAQAETMAATMLEEAISREAEGTIEYEDGSTQTQAEFVEAYRAQFPRATEEEAIATFEQYKQFNAMGQKVPGEALTTAPAKDTKVPSKKKGGKGKRSSVGEAKTEVTVDNEGRTEAGRAMERELTLRELNRIAGKYGITVETQDPDGKSLLENENGFYDHSEKKIILNSKKATNQYMMTYYFVHELTHGGQAVDGDTRSGLTSDIIGAMEKIYGKEAVDKLITDTRAQYEAHFKKTGKDMSVLNEPNYIEDEVAANFLMKAISNRSLLDTLAGVTAKPHQALIRNVKSFLSGKKDADIGVKEAKRLIERMQTSLETAAKNKNTATESGEKKYSFEGYDEETGKGIYRSNFPKGTPKSAKAERILWYIQNVWSKKPIDLVVINKDGSTRKIKAQFDPTYSEDKNVRTDASKLMGGNRHGSASEQRVTLDLADDYYKIASEARYNYPKEETGKTSDTHKDVKQWHYFVNDILFQEQDSDTLEPYTVTVNVKERPDGEFVYSFSAERQKEDLSTRRTLHADVNQAGKTDEANARSSGTKIHQDLEVVKPQKRLSIDDGEYAPTYYSQMERVVQGMKQSKFGASSVVSMLRGRGVKAEEIKWSGVEQWLEGKKSVTKDELLEFIAGSELQIEEYEARQEAMSGAEYMSQETGELGDMGYFYERAYEIAEEMGYDPEDVRFDGYEENGIFYVADRSAEDGYVELLSVEKTEVDDDTRWGQYKLDGGSNYRELQFYLPDSDYTNLAMQAHWGSNAEGVLAHARMQDFETEDGKMLFIEEIQSDWHNAGHRDGYADKNYDVNKAIADVDRRRDELYQKINKEPNLVAVRDRLVPGIIETNRSFGQDINEDTAREYAGNMIMSSFYPAEVEHKGNVTLSLAEKQAIDDILEELRQLTLERIDARTKAEEMKRRAPEAPFSNTYHEYVLKRLLRMAAEEGYDSIGWTTAQQQVDRWSEDYAEGYRIEYDQDIPKFLNKYGKQWGARVGQTALPGSDYAMLKDEIRQGEEDIAEWEAELAEAETDSQREFIQSQIDYIRNEIKRLQAGGKVWSMPITDAMRQSVLYEGQPRYSISAEELEEQIDELLVRQRELSNSLYPDLEDFFDARGINHPERFAEEYMDLPYDSEKILLYNKHYKFPPALREQLDTYFDLDRQLKDLARQLRRWNQPASYQHTVDSDGNDLTDEQVEFFKHSKVRDDNGLLKVMYHGSGTANFHVFDRSFSDDRLSFFFTDDEDVAKSYSGTRKNYSAKAFRTVEDLNDFMRWAGMDGYEVREENGKFRLYSDGDFEAESDTIEDLYNDEIRDWAADIYVGPANYRVYLNLTNPLVVDAEGRQWNEVSYGFSQDLYEHLKSAFTEEEKAALIKAASNVDYQSFRVRLNAAIRAAVKPLSSEQDKVLDSAYWKNSEMESLFRLASAQFSDAAIRAEASHTPFNTRDYAQRAKAQGYDGVIFENLVDLGDYGRGRTPSTVVVAFSPEQIKSVANTEPTSDPDIRYSIDMSSMDEETKSIVTRLKTEAIGAKYVPGRNASMTPERFKSVYRDSAAKGSADYAKQYIAWVNPADFVYATTPDYDAVERIREEAGELDLERLQNYDMPIWLSVNMETGEIVGHEGRHRMSALEKAGVRKVAIVIKAMNTDNSQSKPIGMMRLTGQSFREFNAGPERRGTNFYLHDALPLSERYGKTAYQLFCTPEKEGNIRYSIDPVTGYEEGSVEDKVLKLLKAGTTEDAISMLEQWVADIQAGKVNADTVEGSLKDAYFKAQPLTPQQRADNRKKLDDLVKKYGAIKPGAVQRDKNGKVVSHQVIIPNRVRDTKGVSDFARTLAEDKKTPEWFRDEIERAIADEMSGYTYDIATDKAAMQYVKGRKQVSFEHNLRLWENVVELGNTRLGTGGITKNDIALGEYLYTEAVKAGDVDLATKLAAELATVGTAAGQVVQAMSLLKKMTPSGKLYYLSRTIERLNNQYQKKIDAGKMSKIKYDKDLAAAVLNAKTAEEAQDAMTALLQDVANQIPPTLAERWNAWRYLSMLGNPRTHIRNILSNVVFAPVTWLKDVVDSVLFQPFVKRENRTKHLGEALSSAIYGLTFTGVKLDKYVRFADADYKTMKDVLSGDGKYNPADLIREMRPVFKAKAMDAVAKGNSKALDAEDKLFLREHYVRALSQYLAAQKADVASLSSTPEGRNQLAKARAWAVQEAKKATFRDASALANALSRLERSGVAGQIIVGGVMPFKKTPINILKRGAEYSPLGIVQTVKEMTKGKENAAKTLDSLSSFLTGTGLIALGVYLAKEGLLRASGSDDEKDREFEELQGAQTYSLTLDDGTSYTIDWMAPAALPLFVGAKAFEVFAESGELTYSDYADVLMLIAEPMFQLSMLDGLNNTLTAAGYSDNPVSAVAASMLTGYFGQAIPTLFGQVARTVDDTRRSTYIDKNKDTIDTLDRTVQYNMTKVPGASKMLAPKLDAWGRSDTENNAWLRAFENFISPGYVSTMKTSAMEEELERLYGTTGDNGVLPKSVSKYFTVDKVRRDLTADEWTTYQTEAGQGAYEMLTRLVNSASYQSLSDAQRAKAVKDVFTYADEKAKEAAVSDYATDESWIAKADKLAGSGLSVEDYIVQSVVGGETSGQNTKDVLGMDWLGDDDKALLVSAQYNSGSTPLGRTSETTFTDPNRNGYEYTMTATQVEQYEAHFEELWMSEYNKLISGRKYTMANLDERADMVDTLKSDIAADTKKWMARELRSNGTRSTKKD